MIIIIAAIDANRALGNEGKLLCHLPRDLQYFKQQTWRQSIFMGRKTFAAIGRALPERENFVLTHQKNLALPGCIRVHSLEEAILKKTSENLWVIGGEAIYKLCLPYAEKILLTQIEHAFTVADTFFPVLDPQQWKITAKKFYPISQQNPYALSFITYEKII